MELSILLLINLRLSNVNRAEDFSNAQVHSSIWLIEKEKVEKRMGECR